MTVFRRTLVWVLFVVTVASSCSSSRETNAALPPHDTKIGFIFVGQRDDLGYNQAAWEGADAVAKAFPDNQVLRAENVPETNAAVKVMEDMIEGGARILFATSFGHLEAAREVARRHPEVIVLHQGGVEPEPGLRNLGTYWATVWEPVYQAGIVAGLSSASGRLGFVAAFPIPAALANVNAFTLGARSVNPAATTAVRFTGSWCDPKQQTVAAEDLVASGADVLAQHQDCTQAVLDVAERNGLGTVGYHEDGSEQAPNSWLVGSVWNWRPLFVDMVRTILAGEFEKSPYEGDYRGSYRGGDNPFVLTELGPRVPPAAAGPVEAAAERMRAGRSPFDGPVRDRDGGIRIPPDTTPPTSSIESMDYLVEGVTGDLPS